MVRFGKLLALACTIAVALPLHSQSLLESIREQTGNTLNVYQMQDAFDTWAQDKDLTRVRGWKPLQRKLWLESTRVNPDGFYPDAATFLEGIQAVQAMNGAAQERNASAWWPIGPYGPSPVVNSNYNPGVGRVNTVSFHPTNPDIFYVGAPDGGIWKTTDHGQNWTPVGDQNPVPGVSAIHIDPLYPDTIYIATGDSEYFAYGATPSYGGSAGFERGIGVFKSTDGGLSWNPTGLTMNPVTHHLSLLNTIVGLPDSTHHLLASGSRGIYRSVNGGDNWIRTDDEPVDVLAQSPQSPRTIFAGISNSILGNDYNNQPTILRSKDFGATWQKLNIFTSADNVQRINIRVAPSDSNIVYAVAVATNSGLFGFYRSDDGGDHWEELIDGDSLNLLGWNYGDPQSDGGGQGWYDLVLCVDQHDPNRVFVGGVNLWGSTDGGRSWSISAHWTTWAGPSVHADLHFLRVNPLNDEYYLCSDGGITFTDSLYIPDWSEIEACIDGNGFASGCYDFPTEWTDISHGLAITQFYKLDVFDLDDAYVLGGTQDNSHKLLSNGAWKQVSRGDGMDAAFHPTDPNIFVAASQNGNLHLSTNGGQDFLWNISGTPRDQGATGSWVTPFVTSPTDPFRLFVGFNQLWMLDEAGDWTQLSDLSGGVRAWEVAVTPSNPDAVAMLKSAAGVGGRELWLTRDLGANWEKINGSTNAFNVAQPLDVCFGNNENELYVAFGGYINNFRVFRTLDGGQSWENLSKGFPKVPVISIAHHTGSANNTVYIGTDLGVFYTSDELDEWLPYNTGLPVTRISDIELHYQSGKIYIASFGRGMWANNLVDAPLLNAPEQQAEAPAASIAIVPNPVSGPATIHIDALASGARELLIIDVLGRVRHQQGLDGVTGALTVPVPEFLPAGLYYAQVRQGLRTTTKSFLIEK